MTTRTLATVALLALVPLGLRASGGGDSPGSGRTFYVATDGFDDPRNGSQHHPWASITFAVEHVPDGSTVLVSPGLYKGRMSLGRRYVKGITVRSSVPYRARLRNSDKVIRCYACEGVTIEGFDVAHDGPGAQPLVVQIDGDAGKGGRHVVLRNNVLHDSHRNDILKINNGARGVKVQGNIFYNQASHDEHIDVKSAVDVVIEDNVFFNDFAGSGREPPADSASYIVIKDSNDDEDGILGSQNIVVRRNVFLGWQGGRAFGFLLIGEDGKPYYEARDVLVENNLFLGDSPIGMRSPFGVKGGERTVFRNNTVLGDLPGKAFATRINREGENRHGDAISFFNNVWDDPTGTMSHFSDTRPDDIGSVALSHNLYWNGGAAIPYGREDAVNYTADRGRVVGDPRLREPRGLTAPRWVPERGAFADGSRTVAEARLRLIDTFARPAPGSAAVGRADPRNAPGEDIRGRRRGEYPDIGAFQLGDPGRRRPRAETALAPP